MLIVALVMETGPNSMMNLLFRYQKKGTISEDVTLKCSSIYPSETKATANSFLSRWHEFAALALVKEQQNRL